MMKNIETLADFEDACNRHDLTYSYSDDGSWWRAGLESEWRIQEAAKKFQREEVERIWNAMVDRKLVESARSQFYWRWPQPIAS